MNIEDLFNYNQTHPFPKDYEIIFVSGLLSEYEIPFRVFKVNDILSQSLLTVFEMEGQKWTISSGYLKLLLWEDIESLVNPALKPSDECLSKKEFENLFKVELSLQEIAKEDFDFFQRVGKKIIKKPFFLEWKLNFEKEMLNKTIPHSQKMKISSRL